MRSIVSRRPTVSTVISCTALFVALGGTSYAAVTLDGKDLKNRSVTAKKVKTRTLTGTQIKNDGLTGKQIKESTLGTVPSAQAAQSAQRAAAADNATNAVNAENAKKAENAANAQNAQSAQTATTATTAQNAEQLAGKPASAYASSATRVVTANDPAVEGTAGGAAASVNVSCNADERAIAGGGSWMTTGLVLATSDRVTIGITRPVMTGEEITGWQVGGRNSAVGIDRVLRAYVICTPKS